MEEPSVVPSDRGRVKRGERIESRSIETAEGSVDQVDTILSLSTMDPSPELCVSIDGWYAKPLHANLRTDVGV